MTKEQKPKTKYIKGKHNTPLFFVKTGSELLNAQLNHGRGIPSGVLMQFQSEGEGSYKTTEALKMMGQVQRMGYDVAYVDGENRIILEPDGKGGLRNEWFERLGVDANNMYFVQCGAGEEIWETVIDLIDNYNVKFVVMDSIHSVRPSIDYETSIGDRSMGQHALLHQRGIFKTLPLLSKHNAILLGINQRRDNITMQGKMGTNASGGASWRFYSSYNFIFKKAGSNKSFDGKDLIPMTIFIDKNSGGKAYQSINTFARQGYGFDIGAELAIIATDLKLITKSGSWWKTADGQSIGQGDNARIEWALQNKELILSLYQPETKKEEDHE